MQAQQVFGGDLVFLVGLFLCFQQQSQHPKSLSLLKMDRKVPTVTSSVYG
jgi:hypothetical protein